MCKGIICHFVSCFQVDPFEVSLVDFSGRFNFTCHNKSVYTGVADIKISIWSKAYQLYKLLLILSNS